MVGVMVGVRVGVTVLVGVMVGVMVGVIVMVGFIADEVEEVLPEAVTTRNDGIKAVNYDKVVPLLVQSIKELKKEIQTLKNNK